MIRSAFSSLRRAGMLAAIAAGLGGLPDLGQQRGLNLRPSSSRVATSAPGLKRGKRPDAGRIAAAQAKRERKNAKRVRDWHRSWLGNGATWKGRYWPTVGVNHGK